MPKLTQSNENIHREQIVKHYEIEKRLAAKLRKASKNERRKLYTALYDELFKKVPYHSQIVNKLDPSARRINVLKSLKLFNHLLDSETIFIEIGPGDCALSLEVAKQVKQVYSIDVSEEITKHKTLPPNLDILISDGSSIELPENLADIVYSNQLMEHLHPEDALEQIKNIHKVLKNRGRYYCITPNKYTGPHDISAHFDDVATGFHLKEYSNNEIYRLFCDAGFKKIVGYIGKSGLYIKVPIFLKLYLEKFIEILPKKIKKKFCKLIPVRLLLRIVIVGVK